MKKDIYRLLLNRKKGKWYLIFQSLTINLETFYNNSIPCNYLITSKFLGSLANLAKNIADDFLLIPASSLINVINFGIIYLNPILESKIT